MALLRGHSPQQIAGRAKLEYPGDPSRRVSHETIYLALYALPHGELRKELLAGRPAARAGGAGTGAAASRPWRRSASGPRRRGPPRAGPLGGRLHQGRGQPQRRRHAGRAHQPLRHPRPHGRRRRGRGAGGFTRKLKAVPACLRKTLAYDQGFGVARHLELTVRTKVKVYFADPHSPWQRPGNENANGLIRQYLPKGMDLSKVSQAELNAIARLLNNRPRKVLGFRTPEEVYQEETLKLKDHVALQT